MKLFVIIVNGFQPLTIITKSSTLDVAAVLYPSLIKLLFMLLKLFAHKVSLIAFANEEGKKIL